MTRSPVSVFLLAALVSAGCDESGPAFSPDVLSLRAGETRTCAIVVSPTLPGAVRCWEGPARRATRYSTLSGQAVVDVLPTADECQIEGAALYCDGAQVTGLLSPRVIEGSRFGLAAAPSAPFQPEPERVSFRCAIQADGDAYCWGTIAGTETSTPTRLPFDDEVFAVSLGSDHGCAIVGSGRELFCFGAGEHGQLGTGSERDERVPLALELGDVAAVASGEAFSCALVGDQVSCWGRGDRGQLGDGSAAFDAPSPRALALTGVSAIGAGRAHACAVVTGGVTCWGANETGQAAPTRAATIVPPTRMSMPALFRARALALAESYSCALGSLGEAADGGGSTDAGTMDAGTMDAGTMDAGTMDAGTMDAGTMDAGTMDAGTMDAGTMDAGTSDAGFDAGPLDAGPVDGGPAGGGSGGAVPPDAIFCWGAGQTTPAEVRGL